MDRRKFLITAGASLATPALKDLSRVPAGGKAQVDMHRQLQKPHRPNVIVIICDDLGYGDLGCYGSNLLTPNIGRLSVDGVRFTNHCTPHPICSASRAALLTGLYPTRVNVPGVFFPLDEDGMSLDAITLANVLQNTGYKTMAIGKWHLGDTKEYLPTSRGFDEYYGVPYSVDMDPLPLLHNTQILEPEANRNHLTQQYTKQAVEFIGNSKEKPFFLYMAHSYPHIPLHASEKFRGKSAIGFYGDVVQEIDWSVGEVMHTLEQNGLKEKTLVFFTSDHGPWYQGSTGDLRGRKGSTYEGGVRIPMIVSMPGSLPQGQVTHALASHIDILPTVTNLCGAALPEYPIDGSDIWTLLNCEQQAVERKALLSFNGWNLECARWKQWKLHVSRANMPLFLPAPKQGRKQYLLRNPELYNLASDPKESYDVASEYPEIVATIQESIEGQLTSFPDRVKQAYSTAQLHLSSPWMPAASYNPESESMAPGKRGFLIGADAERVLQRFK